MPMLLPYRHAGSGAGTLHEMTSVTAIQKGKQPSIQTIVSSDVIAVCAVHADWFSRCAWQHVFVDADQCSKMGTSDNSNE